MGALSDHIATLATPNERRAYRAAAWRAIDALDGRTFTPRAGVTITILSSDIMRDGAGVASGVRLHVALTIDAQPVDLGDGVFEFVNPPLAVDVALTNAQITNLRAAFAAGVPTRQQINTWLTNRGLDPATHVLRYVQDRDGVWQFRLLEEAPLKALRGALIDVLRERI
jgi:hypothetical protein